MTWFEIFNDLISLDQSNTQGAVSTTKAVSSAEFKERTAFNRRRGAMRRRVHQVINCWYIAINCQSSNLKISLSRSTGTSSWQHFCASQHFVHIAKNLFGKLILYALKSLQQSMIVHYIICVLILNYFISIFHLNWLLNNCLNSVNPFHVIYYKMLMNFCFSKEFRAEFNRIVPIIPVSLFSNWYENHLVLNIHKSTV